MVLCGHKLISTSGVQADILAKKIVAALFIAQQHSQLCACAVVKALSLMPNRSPRVVL